MPAKHVWASIIYCEPFDWTSIKYDWAACFGIFLFRRTLEDASVEQENEE